jgi:hypothetical protein
VGDKVDLHVGWQHRVGAVEVDFFINVGAFRTCFSDSCHGIFSSAWVGGRLVFLVVFGHGPRCCVLCVFSVPIISVLSRFAAKIFLTLKQ